MLSNFDADKAMQINGIYGQIGQQCLDQYIYHKSSLQTQTRFAGY